MSVAKIAEIHLENGAVASAIAPGLQCPSTMWLALDSGELLRHDSRTNQTTSTLSIEMKAGEDDDTEIPTIAAISDYVFLGNGPRVLQYDVRFPLKPVQVFSDAADDINHVHVSYDGHCMVVSSDDGAIYVYESTDESSFSLERAIAEAHENLIMATFTHPDNSRILISGGMDRLLNMWDLNQDDDHVHLQAWNTLSNPLGSIAPGLVTCMDVTDQRILVGCVNGNVQVFNLMDVSKLLSRDEVRPAQYDDARASAPEDTQAEVEELVVGVADYESHFAAVSSICACSESPSGNTTTFLTASNDKQMCLWSISSMETPVLSRSASHQLPGRAVSMSRSSGCSALSAIQSIAVSSDNSFVSFFHVHDS
eukprot:ANDGO_00090.mRNA.1 hypothetical protein PHYSODRAFT_319165